MRTKGKGCPREYPGECPIQWLAGSVHEHMKRFNLITFTLYSYAVLYIATARAGQS